MNVAIIGCGGMGHMHARMAANAGLKVVVCGDKFKRKADALAKKFDAAASDDCMEVITRPDVDIVAIATPTPVHTQYVVAAAEAGKHVFCEKPFGRTVHQCKEAIAAVKKAGVRLFVGHVVRYFQEFEAIKAQVDAGKIGRVGFIRTYRGGIMPEGEEMWFRDYDQSGGVTFDCVIHDLDWLRYMFGDVDHVFSQHLQRSTPETMDYSQTTLRMKSGVIANVIGTWAHPSGFRVKTELCGESGMIQYDSAESPIHAMSRGNAGAGPGMIVPSSPVPVSPYQLEWEDFVAWLYEEREPRVTAHDALEAVRIGLAALQSAESGKPVFL
ncbi:MAG: Gfo/Idh/MocA family oxidoreductase [Candidatus Hydrogenedentes bacterium]|nr:Gfo/Idh/MocA family oxidoreductase [Candidatus Hydrogenedentota bacterium]